MDKDTQEILISAMDEDSKKLLILVGQLGSKITRRCLDALSTHPSLPSVNAAKANIRALAREIDEAFALDAHAP